MGEQRHVLLPADKNAGGKMERFDAIEPYMTGRDILDVGGAAGWSRDDWMHGLIAEVARSVRGVDKNEAVVAEVRKRGYDFIAGDIADVKLTGADYDAVFAGELVEHLLSFSALLDAARAVLRPHGQLILTTPNAFAFTNFVYRLSRKPPRINPDHTCWFDEDTLRQMLTKAGWSVTWISYIGHNTPGVVRSALSWSVRRALPDRLAYNTLLAVARPA